MTFLSPPLFPFSLLLHPLLPSPNFISDSDITQLTPPTLSFLSLPPILPLFSSPTRFLPPHVGSVGEFSDSDAFLSLSACVAQRPAVSCVLALDSASLADVDNERIRSILDDANVTVRESTIKPASLSSSSSLTMDALHAFTALASETQQQDFSRFLSSERLAAGALQALAAVNDLQRVASSAGGGKLKIAYIDVDKYVHNTASSIILVHHFFSRITVITTVFIFLTFPCLFLLAYPLSAQPHPLFIFLPPPPLLPYPSQLHEAGPVSVGCAEHLPLPHRHG